MNKEEFEYKVGSNNCEHLAFLLALGVKYSTQKEHNILTRQFLNLMDVFF
jgi:hypothetical protein